MDLVGGGGVTADKIRGCWEGSDQFWGWLDRLWGQSDSRLFHQTCPPPPPPTRGKSISSDLAPLPPHQGQVYFIRPGPLPPPPPTRGKSISSDLGTRGKSVSSDLPPSPTPTRGKSISSDLPPPPLHKGQVYFIRPAPPPLLPRTRGKSISSDLGIRGKSISSDLGPPPWAMDRMDTDFLLGVCRRHDQTNWGCDCNCFLHVLLAVYRSVVRRADRPHSFSLTHVSTGSYASGISLCPSNFQVLLTGSGWFSKRLIFSVFIQGFWWNVWKKSKNEYSFSLFSCNI